VLLPAADFRCIALDAPGNGHSDRLPESPPLRDGEIQTSVSYIE
jgi:pimeloyl-ACP methyl ester carboxylesterase